MKILLNLLKHFTGYTGSIFIIGIILIFLGISTGLPSLGIQIEDKLRTVSWALGLMFCLLSIGLRYQEKQEKERPEKQTDSEWKVQELDTTILTKTQKAILEVIVKEYKLQGVVSQDHIEKNFADISKDELYYRLDSLILLKFIEKSSAGSNGERHRFRYRPTAAYREVAHIPQHGTVVPTVN